MLSGAVDQTVSSHAVLSIVTPVGVANRESVVETAETNVALLCFQDMLGVGCNQEGRSMELEGDLSSFLQ